MKLFIICTGLVLSLGFANANEQDGFDSGEELFYSQSEQPPGGGNDPRLFSRCNVRCQTGYYSGSGDYSEIVSRPGLSAIDGTRIVGGLPRKWRVCAAVCACR